MKTLLVILFVCFATNLISDQQKFDFEIKITKTMTLSEAAKLEEKIKDFLEDDLVNISINIVKPVQIDSTPLQRWHGIEFIPDGRLGVQLK